jgi:enoyl-CoA hydratase/carnithine racemase
VTGPANDLCLSTVSEGVCTLTLNNPERRNGWSRAMESRYFDLLDCADADPAVRVIVLTGAGVSFCPGLDMTRLGKVAGAGRIDLDGRRPATYPLTIRKPMIAAINGACAGLGLHHALMCDVRFAARGARFSTAYAQRGLPAENGISWLLPRLIGVENALDLLLSARVFDADEAKVMGLVSRVCEPGEVLGAAQAYACDLAARCSPRSMAAVRAQVYADLSRDLDEAVIDAVRLMHELAGYPDVGEGVASFTEKRPPRFAPLDPRPDP